MEIYDLIIIGAGPAGVTAAVYAARQKMKLLLLSKDMGGQIAKKAVDDLLYKMMLLKLLIVT